MAAHLSFFDFGIHHTSHFLPWHRRFLSIFEKLLQVYVPTITIPYWDSTVDQFSIRPTVGSDFLRAVRRGMESATVALGWSLTTQAGATTDGHSR
ncbi:tyrosinase family protein [Pseudonocardia halophobica]|uniref:tyrosinase family protein n=1 Tax=Pseudonocardia halophobica TaxID=29401 RepID=UPI003D8E8AD8